MRKICKLVVVLLALSFMMASVVKAGGTVQTRKANQSAVVAKKYPPYPDVWGVTDWPLHFCEAKNGEFYVISFPKQSNGQDRPFVIAEFFSQNKMALSEKQVDEVRFGRKAFGNAGTLHCLTPYEHPKALTLSNGFTVRVACLDLFDCEYPSYRYGLEILNQAGNRIVHKSLLYRLPAPRQRYLAAPQMVDKAGEIQERVVHVDWLLVPLDDETFLARTDRGVIRLDRHLNTHSQLEQQGLFLLETTLLDGINQQLGFKNGPETLSDHQALQDAVSEFLEKMTKEKRP